MKIIRKVLSLNLSEENFNTLKKALILIQIIFLEIVALSGLTAGWPVAIFCRQDILKKLKRKQKDLDVAIEEYGKKH